MTAFGIAPNVLVFALAGCLFANAMVSIPDIVAINLNMPNELRGLAIGPHALTSMLFASAGGSTLLSLISRALGGVVRTRDAGAQGRLGAWCKAGTSVTPEPAQGFGTRRGDSRPRWNGIVIY